MKIIRDEEMAGIMMIPLLVEWQIRRCNVKDCKEKPNTIIAQLGPDIPVSGFCETHFQEGNVPEGANFELVWNEFDAFEYNRQLEKQQEMNK